METKRCPKCGDGISYGEKFMYAVLSYAGYDFETQHVFEWSKGENGLKGMKKYDFYIPSERLYYRNAWYSTLSRGGTVILAIFKV